MENEPQAKALQLLNAISVEAAAHRHAAELRGEFGQLRTAMRAGFNRVDLRLGNLETRVEHLETDVHAVKTDLRSFRDEFERRIEPLER
jgi:predicted  nucleic acid-binding Zn-ribbon protein